jgi:hypothetical protein
VRSRSLAIGATLALVSLVVVLAVARSGGSPAVAARPTPRETPAAVTPSAPPVAPETLRDIFRFADDREAPSRAAPALVEDEAAPLAPAPPGPRLVGLIRRSGRLVAALALDGEVVLAGPGDSAAGVTVVSVGDDSVRIRRADGGESTLVLP